MYRQANAVDGFRLAFDRAGQARLVHLDGVGHFSPREAAGDFAAAVIDAVRSTPR